MAFRQMRVSDISGQDLSDNEVVTVVIRSAGKVFDCSVEELAPLKAINNVEELDVRYPNGESKTLLVTKAELSKLVPDDKVAGFDGSRGRRSGYSPTRNGAVV